MKIISTFLAFLILLSGCKVYYKTPQTIDQGIESGGRVKVITISDKVFTFDKLINENDVIYGIKTIKGEETKTIIHRQDIKEVRLYNKTASGFGSLGIILGSILAFYLLLFATGAGGDIATL